MGSSKNKEFKVSLLTPQYTTMNCSCSIRLVLPYMVTGIRGWLANYKRSMNDKERTPPEDPGKKGGPAIGGGSDSLPVLMNSLIRCTATVCVCVRDDFVERNVRKAKVNPSYTNLAEKVAEAGGEGLAASRGWRRKSTVAASRGWRSKV